MIKLLTNTSKGRTQEKHMTYFLFHLLKKIASANRRINPTAKKKERKKESSCEQKNQGKEGEHTLIIMNYYFEENPLSNQNYK
jgi:hypothetical protein